MKRAIFALALSLTCWAQSNKQQVMIASVDQPATPTDSPGGGTYGSTQSVTLSDATAQFILYTTNGSTPSCPSTGTLYSGAFNISVTTTLKAIGCNGITGGGVLTSVYTINSGISLVSHGCTASVNGNSASVTLNTTGANLLTVYESYLNGTSPTPSDSVGGMSNTFTGLTAQTTAGVVGRLFYVLNPTHVGASHVFTINVSGSFPNLCVASWSGSTGSFDAQIGNTDPASSGATFIQSGSLTPASANELLVLGFGDNESSTAGWSIDSGFSTLDFSAAVGGGAFAAGFAYIIETTATAKNPKWNSSDSSARAIVMGAFK